MISFAPYALLFLAPLREISSRPQRARAVAFLIELVSIIEKRKRDVKVVKYPPIPQEPPVLLIKQFSSHNAWVQPLMFKKMNISLINHCVNTLAAKVFTLGFVCTLLLC